MSQMPIKPGTFNPMTGQMEPGTFTPPTEPLVSAGGDWWDQQGVPNDPNEPQVFTPGAGKDVGTLPALPSGPYHHTTNQGSSSASLGQPAIVRNNTGIMGGQPGGGVSGGTGGYQPFNEAVMRSILEKYTPDYAGVRRASEELDRTFGPGVVKLLDHPTKLDKFQLPDGRVIDTVIGAGAPGASWTWAPEGGGGGATLGGVMGGGVGNLLGSPMAGRSITDDPSYQFRFGEGLKALERSAAAKGTLLTGGMMKALTRYGQDVASTEYQNAYARAASEQGNNFNRLFSVAGMGLTGTNNAQQLASGYASSIGNGQLAAGNAQAAGTAGQANAWANTVGNLGNIAGQTNWVRKPGADPNNTGNYLDVGRGLY